MATREIPATRLQASPYVQTCLRPQGIADVAAVENNPLIDCTRDVLTNPLLSQLPADLRPVAKCLIRGESPETCAIQEVLNKLPPEARGIAQCIGDKSPQTCAIQQVLDKLPPEVRGIAQCISRGQDIGACGRQFAMQGDLKRAFDAINGLDVDRAARNPLLQADRTVQNIICTIKAVDKEDWVDVVRCGGTEIAKKVVKTILAAVASPALVGVMSPLIDAMIQDRVDFVAEVVKAAKAGDEGTLAELAVEAYILTGTPLAGITAICHLLPDGAVKELTCGAIGDAVRWVTGAGGDAVEAIAGNACEAPPNFFRANMGAAWRWASPRL